MLKEEQQSSLSITMLAGILIRLAAFVAIAINPSSLFDLNGAYAPSNIHDGIEGIAINSSSAAELKGSYATPEIHDDVKDVYDAAIEKGNSLLCLFTSIATPRPGAFQNWDQLQQYGWKVIESRALDSPGDVSSMLDALGLSKNQGVNYWLGIQHTGDFKNKDGVTGVSAFCHIANCSTDPTAIPRQYIEVFITYPYRTIYQPEQQVKSKFAMRLEHHMKLKLNSSMIL